MTEDQIREIVRDEITKMLGDYSNIGLKIQNGFSGVGFAKSSGKGGSYPTTTYGGTGTYVIPAVPSGVLNINIGGTVYKIPYQ
jgi:hypothetical protein